MTKRSRNQSTWAKELNDLIRGASGGFLFGIPLIYTMEVWWIGSHVEPPLTLGLLVITYVVVLFFNRIEGFRRHKRDDWLDAALESLEALAIGLVCSALILVLLQRVTLETSVDEALGKIIFEGVPFALGAALARLILSGEEGVSKPTQSSDRSGNRQKKRTTHSKIIFKDTLADLSATLMGAMIIAFNIAPTDEIPQLAAAASPPWLLAIMVASLIISYGIVFASGFTSQQKRQQQQGLFQTSESETIFSYLVSLLASALMLWFFQRLSFSDPWFLWLRYTLILGLPATIGGAAGRIAV